jgi:hypothetical protein
MKSYNEGSIEANKVMGTMVSTSPACDNDASVALHVLHCIS